MMAFRVARAFTGKSKILKFHGGFHGWHDAASIGVVPPYDIPMSIGVPAEVGETVVAVPFGNPAQVEEALHRHPDIAGIIIEPGGPFTSTVPCSANFLRALRELSSRHGAVLIFDEVVTGFRYARGGAQEAFGVLPDLTTLGKVMGGGLPVGALAGKREVMDVLAWRADPNYARFEMVPHPGTWNANPAVAAAGTATLRIVRDTDVIVQAETQSRKIIDGLNAVFEDEGIKAFAYGRGGMFKTCLGQVPGIISGDDSNHDADVEQLFGGWGPNGEILRKAMICEGIDLMRKDGMASAAHTDADVEQTCAAMGRAIRRMKREGYLPTPTTTSRPGSPRNL
jgi:glutamate-1-semialdehyde 2,1-aminomutase